MEKNLNLYEKLNDREKYILDKLEIMEEDLKLEHRDIIINIGVRMTSRISELPITQEQFYSTYEDISKLYCEFKDNSPEEYSKAQFNIFRALKEESITVLKILEIEIEDKEISKKEYDDKMQEVVNNFLKKFGTGIKQKECHILISKILRMLDKIEMELV